MPSRRRQSALTALAIAPALLLGACTTGARLQARAVAAGGGDHEADGNLTSLGLGTGEREIDHHSFELAFGMVEVGAEGRKRAAGELTLARDDFEVTDATEFGVGGRLYFDLLPRVQPYLALRGVGIFFEDHLGAEFGARFGGGVEMPLVGGWFLDAGVDRLFSLLAGGGSLAGVSKIEVDGFRFYAGLGWALE